VIQTAEKQLSMIREIGVLLAAASVRWWLFGGWAVDFHLGQVTRDHRDIEFYIWQEDAATVSRIFMGAEFAPREIPFPDEAVEFTKNEQLVCAVLLVRDARGDIVIPGRWINWPWPGDAFNGPPANIGDLEVPIVTPEALLDRSLHYQEHAPGAPGLRERDVAAIGHLRAVVASRSVDDW